MFAPPPPPDGTEPPVSGTFYDLDTLRPSQPAQTNTQGA